MAVFTFPLNGKPLNRMKQVIFKIRSKLWKTFVQKKVFVFGDSHTEIFQYINETQPFCRIFFEVKGIGGATAQGLRNPNSKTNALKEFESVLTHVPTGSRLFFLLGEVDTGFVIWYRAQKYNESVEEQLELAVTSYFQFIDKYKNKHNITVMSAPLPTIEDGQTWGEIANARSEVKASKLERTNLTLRYNTKLAEQCKLRNIRFLDFDKDLTDPNTGMIKSYFKNSDPNNHHLDIKKYSDLVLNRI